MKKFTFLLTFTFAAAFAEDQERLSYWDYHPTHLGGNFIRTMNADVTPKHEKKTGDLYFQKANAFWYMLLPVSETSFFFPRVEYNVFRLKWDKNPKFKESRFSYMQFGLTFFSYGLKDWKWIARYDYNIDIDHFSRPGQYGLNTWLLWGAYKFHRKWHSHIGTTGYVGMKGSTVYPLLGLDYAPNKLWTFQAIFPIQYAIQYQATNWCRLSLQGRPLRERFRTGKHEAQPRSIFDYKSMGAEFNVFMEKERRLEFEAYAGYNFGGDFYIKNQKGKNALYTTFGGSPYAGAKLDLSF